MELNFKDINWKSIFLKRYKGLGLTETDVMVVLMADEITQMDGAMPVTADTLSQYMVASKDSIDESLMRLMDRKFVSYDTSDGNLTLTPLFARLFSDFKKDIVLASDGRSKKKIDESYAFLQQQLGRPLSGIEIDKINSWLAEGATNGIIQEAFYKIQSSNKRVTFNRLEKEILRLEKEKDITQEGYTARDDEHRATELPKVISRNWLDD